MLDVLGSRSEVFAGPVEISDKSSSKNILLSEKEDDRFVFIRSTNEALMVPP